MSLLLNAQNLTKSFASGPLFSGIDLAIYRGDQIGVVGPNGSGKSTLLKMIAGQETPDSGLVAIKSGVRVGVVAQESTFENTATISSTLNQAMRGYGRDEHELLSALPQLLGDQLFDDLDIKVSSLSGGWRKRLSIICTLLGEPDLLILDEPTNHLDLEGILWLEELLTTGAYTTLIVSHDRYFLDTVATKIVEVNRIYPKGTFTATGSYGEFLGQKADYLATQAKEQDSLTNRLRREEEWLRRGPKARTTKSSARIAQAHRMQDELKERQARERQASVSFEFTNTGRKTKKLISVTDVSKELGGRTLIKHLNFVLSPGMRLGLLGLNGSGKSTLLKMLANQMPPTSGKMEWAQNLKIAYFDQQREALPDRLTLKRALAPDSDSVLLNGRSLHVVSYARQFAFQNAQLETPVARLSGGERARLYIARLLLQPADVLLLDEPTNDLDIDTLETLEENLLAFPGALVLVTHDRYFLDRVSTGLLALDGKGGTEFFADYAQWESHARQKDQAAPAIKPADKAPTAAPPKAPLAKKLSYKEQREWEQMEGLIAAAEERLALAQKTMDAPDISTSSSRLQAAATELQNAEQDVERLYARWAEIEGKLT